MHDERAELHDVRQWGVHSQRRTGWKTLIGSVLVLLVTSTICDAQRDDGEMMMMRTPKTFNELLYSMYQDVSSHADRPCVLLLHTRGEAGCSGATSVRGKLLRTEKPLEFIRSAQPKGKVVLLLPASVYGDLLAAMKKDTSLMKAAEERVAGILIEDPQYEYTSRKLDISKIASFSPDATFPQAQFANYVYKEHTLTEHDDNNIIGSGNFSHSFNELIHYNWNPADQARDIMKLRIRFPMFMLDHEATKKANLLIQDSNLLHKQDKTQSYYCSLDSEMSADGEGDSFSCLKHNTCQPLGGFSVVTDLFRRESDDISGIDDEEKKPLLFVSSMSSTSFFRDGGYGADAPLSGYDTCSFK